MTRITPGADSPSYARRDSRWVVVSMLPLCLKLQVLDVLAWPLDESFYVRWLPAHGT